MPENWVSKINFCTELGLYVGSSHPKTVWRFTKPPCKVCPREKISKTKNKTKKTNKTGIPCKVVTPQRQDQVWSSSLAMLLMKLRTAVVVKPEKWVSKIIIHTEMGLFTCLNWQSPLASKQQQRLQEKNKKKTKIIFSQKRARMLCYWGHRI